MSEKEKIDLDGDGIISQKESKIYEDKIKNVKMMAWVALAAMVGAAIAILFVLPDMRVEKLGATLDLFWIAMGSITGAFVGVTTFMGKK